ncbi:MAG: isoleucine--tRNA ligase [Oligoflexales bacterium]|nr:isoleucine--tRNA ligase [Oligoflexales bacterium]
MKKSAFPKHQFDEKNLALEWTKNSVFQASIDQAKDRQPFVFFEGPPSANGQPGIHHVMARTLKDTICRYQSMKGKKVLRKAGWDTHGLPVELGVEKSLGLKKEDIGDKISVKEFNQKCRDDVMKYTEVWEKLTDKMGYWVDMKNPYVTYDNKYIESVWWALAKLYEKGLLYKGYTIQPYSPMAGTGLSSHELNQPGCYRQVKDTSVIAQFKLQDDSSRAQSLSKQAWAQVYFLAWTTTPWTLPSNTGLAVGEKISYVLLDTYNRYTAEKISVLLAEDRLSAYFKNEAEVHNELPTYQAGDAVLPFKIVERVLGSQLQGLRYQQLMNYAQPEQGDPFRVVCGDFVTTSDGTGIVHIAPSFGADDQRVGKINNLGSLTLVDLKGRFVPAVKEFAGVAVKAEYEPDTISKAKDYQSVDVRIAIKLKQENRAFLVEKYEHSYPHCWRTDKPILYYPLDSWFIKSTEYKQKMIDLNKTINWHPPATGEGRFGNWLENLVDWNLSRSRYWGVPLPIWSSADGTERKIIGSVAELKKEIEAAVKAGIMQSNPLKNFDAKSFSQQQYESIELHRPEVDEIFLVGSKGQKLQRESDIIDVWFDSGAMPFAQWHYPFENQEVFQQNFPADFIAEGVDQTRGWFFTLHAIATMLFDSVAYKNVISSGLLLDKNGQKMSKRLGNIIDPFALIDKHGADAVRWYLLAVSNPWDDLRFDENGITEVKRKFFNTLENTYNFFTLYANVDNFDPSAALIPVPKRTELDRWILSELHLLIAKVNKAYSDYDLTTVARSVLNFTNDHLSNWYVRLSRRRFWKGEQNQDKQAAYQTLYECLTTICQLSAPIAPFYSDYLYQCLTVDKRAESSASIHLSLFPKSNDTYLDQDLMQQMRLAQDICSLTLSVREKEKIKVRQPLKKLLIPVIDTKMQSNIEKVAAIILHETNIKEIEYVSADSNIFKRRIKANFKTLGPRLGAKMKAAAQSIAAMTQEQIRTLQEKNSISLLVEGEALEIFFEDVEIVFEEQQGLSFASNGKITVTLDINIDEVLFNEGLARELTKHIQNLRKDKGFEITDRIILKIEKSEFLAATLAQCGDYIINETLAAKAEWLDKLGDSEGGCEQIKIDQTLVRLSIQKL